MNTDPQAGLNSAPEVEPTRPEGTQVRSPGWRGTGDRVSEETAARKMDDWVNSAQKRDQDTHQRLADYAERNSSKEQTAGQKLDDFVKAPERGPDTQGQNINSATRDPNDRGR